VTQPFVPIVMRALVASAVIVALGLSACGVKGPLEPPPSAQATQKDEETDESRRPGVTRDGRSVAPRGEKKPFFLDWLLN
jgi:predicted small lipoprotein YifL